MKKQVFLIMVVMMMTQSVFAQTRYPVVSPSGQTLWYVITDGYATVTYPNSNGSYLSYSYIGCTEPVGSLIIPSSVVIDGVLYDVQEIGSGAFRECGITSVTIPNTITHIGAYAFGYCDSLMEIVSLAPIAPTTSSVAFAGVSGDINVFIPCGSYMYYYTRWSHFSEFIENDAPLFSVTSSDSTMGVINIITAPTCSAPTAIIYANAYMGYRFDHWNDGNTDNPRTLSLISDSSIVGYFTTQSNDTVFYYDTTYITVHDTTVLHDTTYLPVYVHDTTTIYDTLYVNVTIHDTIIAYVNVPVHDTVFAYIEVPVHDTIWLHDTITIHDTIYITSEGIDGVDALNAKVYSCNGQIVVDGASGNTVMLYDSNGRVLATKQDYGAVIRFDAPTSGTYMIKIGIYPARKVVVIR